MTVADMIALLQEFAGDLPLLVDGYEMGFDDPKSPKMVRAHMTHPEGSVIGKYDEYDPEGWHSSDDGDPFVAIVIGR